MRRFTISKPAAVLAVFAAAAVWLTLPGVARAADAGIGVARMSVVSGDVAIGRGDSTAVAAVTNAPVLGADYVTTGNASRAEVQLDGTAMVRLDSGVQMRFTHLERVDRAMQLAQGTIELRLLRAGDGQFDVDTPSISLRPRRDGTYRIAVDADGTTQVTVRSGEADVIAGQSTRVLASGNTLIARGAASNPTLQSVDAIAYDDFDRFNAERDARAEHALAAAASYVDGSMGGIDDLNTYGRWVNDGSYGDVWVPQYVSADWAPYRDGRWVWEDGFGWTWLASEPWGWAPYHYGRWYRSPVYGWCWYPPARGYFPVWQPALVAFFGFGGNFGFGFNTIGWVPLAPFEPFFPWWHSGFGHTTIYNITNVTNVYNNGNGGMLRRLRNAPYATAQPGKRFLLGRFDHPVTVPAAQLAHAQVLHGTLPAVPTAANLRFSDKPAAASLSGSALQQRAFAGRSTVVPREPFEQQRSVLAAVARRAFATLPAATNVNVPAHVVPVTVHAAPAAVSAGAHTPTAAITPWRRFEGTRTPTVIVGTDVRAGAASGAAAQPLRHGTTADPWARFGARAVDGEAPAAPTGAPRIEYGPMSRGSIRKASTETAADASSTPSRASVAPTVRMPNEGAMRRVQPDSAAIPRSVDVRRSDATVNRAPAPTSERHETVTPPASRPAPPHAERTTSAPPHPR